MDTLFSFLARKTDFYHGGAKGQAEKTLMEKFKKYEKVALEKHQKEVEERDEADRVRKEKLMKKREEEDAASSKIVEVNDDEAQKIIQEQEAKKNTKVENGSEKKSNEEAVEWVYAALKNINYDGNPKSVDIQ